MTENTILIMDGPKTCLDCPVCSLDQINGDYICGKTEKCIEEYFNKKPNWCLLKHPLKEVSDYLYINVFRYLEGEENNG